MRPWPTWAPVHAPPTCPPPAPPASPRPARKLMRCFNVAGPPTNTQGQRPCVGVVCGIRSHLGTDGAPTNQHQEQQHEQKTATTRKKIWKKTRQKRNGRRSSTFFPPCQSYVYIAKPIINAAIGGEWGRGLPPSFPLSLLFIAKANEQAEVPTVKARPEGEKEREVEGGEWGERRTTREKETKQHHHDLPGKKKKEERSATQEGRKEGKKIKKRQTEKNTATGRSLMGRVSP